MRPTYDLKRRLAVVTMLIVLCLTGCGGGGSGSGGDNSAGSGGAGGGSDNSSGSGGGGNNPTSGGNGSESSTPPSTPAAPDLIPTVSIDTPTTDQTIFAGKTVNFTSTSSGGDGTLTYNWDFGGGASSSNQASPGAISFDTAGTFVVTLTVTDANGSQATDSVGVTVFSVQSVHAGDFHSCALMSSGSVQCWGSGAYGRLGDNNNADHSSGVPTDVVDLTDASKLAVGETHSCVLMDGGTVKCWGQGDYGQLGDNNTNSHFSATPIKVEDPSDVSGFLTNVSQVILGGLQSCVILDNQRVKCWGRGNLGALGDNNTSSHLSGIPVNVQDLGDVTGFLNDVGSMSLAQFHACAVVTDGRVKCWGSGSNGTLGDNNTSSHSSGVPVDVVDPSDASGFLTNVTQTTTSTFHTCALIQGGRVKCWGSGSVGRLGDNNTNSHSSGVPVNVVDPSDVSGFLTNVEQLASSQGTTCAVITGSRVRCWGYGNDGVLGDNDTSDHMSGIPVSVVDPDDPSGSLSNVQSIGAEMSHFCAVVSNGRGVKCWGMGIAGLLGDGDTTDHASGVPVGVLF